MKKSFMTRALAMGLSLAMAFSLSAATNVSVASAATAKPAMKSKSISVKVGQTKNYNATDATKKNYAIKNVKLSAEGKKAASVTWTAGKITVTGKAADSTKRNVKITFKNRKTKKNYYVTLKLVVKAAPEEEQKPAVSTAAAITAIKQTEATKFAAEFSADMTDIKYTDLKIVRDETKAVVTVKSATVDKKDNTKVTIETYEALTDGKAYTVTYTAKDEAKTESSAFFTATAGVVADIALNTYTVPANTATTIKYQLLDANGVIIEQKGIGKSAGKNMEISVENFNGYQSDDKLLLYKTGDKATVKVVYHTWKYNNTDGKEEGKVEKPFEITAVDPSNVIETYEFSIANKGAAVDFKRDTLKKQIAIEDDKEPADPWAYFYFCKADGTDITDSLDYTVTSGNENVLLANGDVAGGAQLTPVGVGATYLMIKNSSGAVIQTLPINVVAKRELSTMTVDKSNVTVSETSSTAGTQRITIAVMDQYSDAYTKYTAAAKPELKSNNNDSGLSFDINTTPDYNKIYIDVTATNATPGTYVYTLDLTDDGKATNVKKVTFSVTVSRQVGAETFALVMMNNAQTLVVPKVDTTVYAGGYTPITLKPTIVTKSNGSIIGVTSIGGATDRVASYGALTLTKNGTVVDKDNKFHNYYGNNNVQANNAYINVSEKKTITALGGNTETIVKNLEPGTYTLTLTAMIDGKKQNMSTSFIVEDSQKVFEATVKDETVDTGKSTLQEVFEDTEYVTFNYAGHLVNSIKNPYRYFSAETSYTNVKKAIRVKKVTVDIVLPGTGDQVVRMTAAVDRTFTFADDIASAGKVTDSIGSFTKSYTDTTGALKTTATLDECAKAAAAALSIKDQYEALSAAEKTTELKAKVDKAVAAGEQAAARIVSDPAYFSAMNLDIFAALGYTDGVKNFDDDEYPNYIILLGGSTGTTSLRAGAVVPEVVDVTTVKSSLESMFNSVKEAKNAAIAQYTVVQNALTVSNVAIVTDGATKVFTKPVSELVTVTAQGIDATSGAIATTGAKNLTIATSSGVELTVTMDESSKNAVSGSGLKAVVNYDVVVSKSVSGKGGSSVVYYANSAKTTTTKATTLKYTVTYTNNKNKDKFDAAVATR